MLTYERETVLMGSLARLYGLPYLNKVFKYQILNLNCQMSKTY